MEDAWVSSEGGKRWECEAGDGRGGEGRGGKGMPRECSKSLSCQG